MAEPNPLIRQATEWRLRHLWSQDRVAAKAGFTQANISHMESGKHSPTLVAFLAYLQAMGLDLQIVVLPDRSP